MTTGTGASGQNPTLHAKPGTARISRPCCPVVATRGPLGAATPFDHAVEVLLRWPDGVGYWHPGPASDAPPAERAVPVPASEIEGETMAWFAQEAAHPAPGAQAHILAEDGEVLLFWRWADGSLRLRASAPRAAGAGVRVRVGHGRVGGLTGRARGTGAARRRATQE